MMTLLICADSIHIGTKKDKSAKLHSLVCVGFRLYSIKDIYEGKGKSGGSTFSAEFRIFYEWQDTGTNELVYGKDCDCAVPEVKFSNAVTITPEDCEYRRLCLCSVHPLKLLQDAPALPLSRFFFLSLSLSLQKLPMVGGSPLLYGCSFFLFHGNFP